MLSVEKKPHIKTEMFRVTGTSLVALSRYREAIGTTSPLVTSKRNSISYAGPQSIDRFPRGVSPFDEKLSGQLSSGHRTSKRHHPKGPPKTSRSIVDRTVS